jgi:HSP20 family molecular chaperone IbpA
VLRRSVTLPSQADEDKITARYDNGVLEVTVPLRRPEASGHPIPIEKAG